MAQREGASRRKVWPNVAAGVLFFVVAVVSLVRGDYWLALVQFCVAGVMGLLAGRADERGGVLAVLMWVLLGISVLAFVALVAR